MWNVADGTTLKLPTEVKFADFSPDGQELVATMDDGTAQIWDLARRAPLNVLNQTTDRSERENRIATSVFSPDGRHILTTQLGAGAWLWNATSRARIALEDSGPHSVSRLLAGRQVHSGHPCRRRSIALERRWLRPHCPS